MTAYYNEIDPKAAAWLRALIDEGHIAPGEVDERSIEDVTPTDLDGFTQCHFFAGIGVWSYALRQAGWPDDRPVWTGSCPCQPFSSAGQGAGFDDERHLWPALHWLVSQCRPIVCFGEQVAGSDGLAWLDLVSDDLEGIGYSCGAAVTAACGFGAPHIRKRLYWVGHANGQRLDGDQPDDNGSEFCSRARELADATGERLQGRYGRSSDGERTQQRSKRLCEVDMPNPTNGFWRDADWLGCTDGKFRPVEPSTFPLAHRATERVGRLRGYGNAIVAPQAQAFIESYQDVNNATHI